MISDTALPKRLTIYWFEDGYKNNNKTSSPCPQNCGPSAWGKGCYVIDHTVQAFSYIYYICICTKDLYTFILFEGEEITSIIPHHDVYIDEIFNII